MNNLIPDIIKAIKKINDEKAYLKDELKKASTKDELNLLQKQFNDLSFNAQRVVLEDFKTVDLNALFSNDLKSFFDSIPKPKDGLNGKDGKNGLDAVVDYDSLNKYLNDKVADIKIPEAEKVNYDLIKSTINELVNQFTLTIKNGIDGKDGKDGVGIQDIKDNKGYFEIILSNGNKKKINKPLDGINRHGGGFAVNNGGTIDAYTKTESDLLLADKANASEVYNKSEVDTNISTAIDDLINGASNILDSFGEVESVLDVLQSSISANAQGIVDIQPITTTTHLNFGIIGTKYKLFTISDANLTSGKKVTNIIYKPSNNKLAEIVKESIDDDEFDSIDFSIRNISSGSFQILAKSYGIINNYKTIQYTIQ